MNTTTLRPPFGSVSHRLSVAAVAMTLLLGIFGIAGLQVGSDGSDQARPKPFPPAPVERVQIY